MRTPFRFTLALATTLGIVASLALVGGALAAETTLTATLEGGAAEVPNGGDPDGSGAATVVLDPAAGTACWNFTTVNVGPGLQSHIHEAPAGTAGGVVVPFDVDGFGESSEGCVEDQDAALLQRIIDDPSEFYVNVHTEAFQGGAVRGQLAAAGQPNTAVSEPVGTSPIVAIGLALLGLSVVIGIRTLRPSTRRG